MSKSFSLLDTQLITEYERLNILDLLKSHEVTEIAINKPGEVWFLKNAEWQKREGSDESNFLIEQLARLMINTLGNENKQFNNENPILSITSPTNERAQFTRAPVTQNATLTIRIPSYKEFSLDDYENQGMFNRIKTNNDEISESDLELQQLLKNGEYKKFIEKAIFYKKNIVFSGATNSGKTTFMKSMISLFDDNQRIITIEDAREIFTKKPNIVNLLYPKNQTTQSITAKDCLESTLRMNPDRIILAELRGDEAYYFVRACTNGHSGNITSCHADSALVAYNQIALMINACPEGKSLNYDIIKQLVFMAIDVSINISNVDGHRFISSIDFSPERKQQILRKNNA